MDALLECVTARSKSLYKAAFDTSSGQKYVAGPAGNRASPAGGIRSVIHFPQMPWYVAQAEISASHSCSLAGVQSRKHSSLPQSQRTKSSLKRNLRLAWA